jgi:hypothetical protein
MGRDSRLGVVPPSLRPYALLCALVLYIPALLWTDAHLPVAWPQLLLGALTAALLVLALRSSPPAERRLVWTCVVLATGLEAFAALAWGEYRYRFGNLPLFVPFGHGMICLFALRAAGTPLMLEHGRGIARLALVLAGGWALAGLTLVPWVMGGRKDSGGALLFPVFLLFMLRSPRFRVFTAVFFATSVLELFGTGFGNWTWATTAPVVGFRAGNPPSVIAGAYCVLDGAAIGLGALVMRAWSGRPGVSPVGQPKDLASTHLAPIRQLRD